MSRTKKDRPHWVRVNDPKSSRYASHHHMVTCREKIDEEPIYRRALDKDGWHWHDEVIGQRPIYRLWQEEVPCTLDRPVEAPSSWRQRPKTLTDDEFNEHRRNDKHCNYWLNYDGDYVSGKFFKRLTHSAERGKVRVQLHNAVRDNGRWIDYPFLDEDAQEIWYEDWEDVDIHNDSKYASRGWWDW